MKKLFFASVLFLGAGIGLVSCSKDEEATPAPTPTLQTSWMQTNIISYTNAFGTINVNNTRLDSGKYYYDFKASGVVSFSTPTDTTNGTYSLNTNNELTIIRLNSSTGRIDTTKFQTVIYSLDSLRLENRKVQYVANDSIVSKVILRFKK